MNKSQKLGNVDLIIYDLLKLRKNIVSKRSHNKQTRKTIIKYFYENYMIKITKNRFTTVIRFYSDLKPIKYSHGIEYHHTISYQKNQNGFNYHSTTINKYTKKHTRRNIMFKLNFDLFKKDIKKINVSFHLITFQQLKSSCHVFFAPITNQKNFPIDEYIDILLAKKPLLSNKYKNSPKPLVIITKNYNQIGFAIRKKKNYFKFIKFEESHFIGSELTGYNFIKNINTESKHMN